MENPFGSYSFFIQEAEDSKEKNTITVNSPAEKEKSLSQNKSSITKVQNEGGADFVPSFSDPLENENSFEAIKLMVEKIIEEKIPIIEAKVVERIREEVTQIVEEAREKLTPVKEDVITVVEEKGVQEELEKPKKYSQEEEVPYIPSTFSKMEMPDLGNAGSISLAIAPIEEDEEPLFDFEENIISEQEEIKEDIILVVENIVPVVEEKEIQEELENPKEYSQEEEVPYIPPTFSKMEMPDLGNAGSISLAIAPIEEDEEPLFDFLEE